jgi:uncharacterized membrane protein YhiD involved in acid resistance
MASIVFGIAAAFLHTVKNSYNKNFVVTLALLPAIVQTVIMLVNGNIGAGVAVAGAFSLVRFRSIPGGAREIGSIFFAMAIGFVTGMGYLFYAAFFLAAVGAVNLFLSSGSFGAGGQDQRTLKITIPENLDYDGLFDDLFKQYAVSVELEKVKTTNLGSLYELSYLIRLKTKDVPKAFIDALRCRNGNLTISIGRRQTAAEEL